MNKKIVFRLTFILFAIAALLFLIFIGKKEKTTDLATLDTKPEAALSEKAISKPNDSLTKKAIPQSNTDMMRKTAEACLQKKWEFSNLTQLKDQILLAESITEESIELENIHFADIKKENYRAQIISTDGRKELRLFKVLADGLPEVVELPAADKINPDSTTLAKYIDWGNVHWHQIQRKLKTALGNTLMIETIDSQVQKLDYYPATGTSLHCLTTECQCK